MQDKVGSVIPSEQEVTTHVETVDTLRAKLERCTVTLTKDERQATTKPRAGDEVIVATVADLATRYGVVSRPAR